MNLDYTKIIDNSVPTEFGKLLVQYFEHRAEVINNVVRPKLMDADEARVFTLKYITGSTPPVQYPTKKNGEKAGPSYYAGIINMPIEEGLSGKQCNYNPMELTAFTEGGFPIRSLSRRVDGSFPNVVNPIALWEIKEYYYTTTFGSV